MQIQISDLVKTFGDKIAVDIPSFTINSGDILGLVGNNGAGKTTLFRLMLDLIKADGGHIAMRWTAADGTQAEADPSQSEDWKAATGAYIDDGFLIDFLTPEEYFHFTGKVNGLTEQETDERLAGFANFMNDEILGQRKLIRNLSAGNRQKTGIIAAMLNRPSLLVLDEPFNFIDPSSQHHLKQLLADYHRQTGATILISSHNLAHTVGMSTRIALLEGGRIIKDLPGAGDNAAKELEDYFNLQ